MEEQIAEFAVRVENLQRTERVFGQRRALEVRGESAMGGCVTFIVNDPWGRFADKRISLDELLEGDVTVKVFLRTAT